MKGEHDVQPIVNVMETEVRSLDFEFFLLSSSFLSSQSTEKNTRSIAGHPSDVQSYQQVHPSLPEHRGLLWSCDVSGDESRYGLIVRKMRNLTIRSAFHDHLLSVPLRCHVRRLRSRSHLVTRRRLSHLLREDHSEEAH